MREWHKDSLGKIIGSTEKMGNVTYSYDELGNPMRWHDDRTDVVMDRQEGFVGNGIGLLNGWTKR